MNVMKKNYVLQEFTVPEQAQRIVHMLEDYEAQRKRNDEELFTKVCFSDITIYGFANVF